MPLRSRLVLRQSSGMTQEQSFLGGEGDVNNLVRGRTEQLDSDLSLTQTA
jgi:hypothetical protein